MKNWFNVIRGINPTEVVGVMKNNMENIIKEHGNRPVCIHMQPKNIVGVNNEVAYESTLRKDSKKPSTVTKTLTVQGQKIDMVYDIYVCDVCKQEVLVPRVENTSEFFSDMAQLADAFKQYTDVDPYIRANMDAKQYINTQGLVGNQLVDNLYRDKKGPARRFNILSLRIYIDYIGSLAVTMFKTINGSGKSVGGDVQYDVAPARKVFKKVQTGYQRPVGQVSRVNVNQLNKFTPTYGE